MLTMVVLAACGGGARPAAGSSTGTSVASPDNFCAAMLLLDGSGTSSSDLQSAYRDAVANAPDEIRTDTATFVANARAVTAAFAAASAQSQSVDTGQVLAGLTPEQRQFATDLAVASQGSIPTGPTGHVLTYVQSHCSPPGSASSSSFSSVANTIN